jgi:hypothetical protein
MAALSHCASASASSVALPSIDVEIQEGDWGSYKHHRAQLGGRDLLPRNENLALYRRQCALAYLGKRAQFHGGVCNKVQPRILTPRFIMELDATNRNQRFTRYPWLEKLTDLIDEIEREQEKISISNNVISLMAASK